MGAPVLLLDGFSLLFRAHHALPPMTTSTGLPTSALYGFSSVLLKLLREHRPRAIAVAVDAPGGTFRHARFAGYKAGRPKLPDALATQIPLLDDLVAALGAPLWRAPGWEADDILATLARDLRDRDEPALVVSGDRDLLQLAHGSVRVLFVGRRGKDAVLYDADAVTKRFGVPAERLPSYVALVGDPSDAIPAVSGIGSAGAARVFARFTDAADLFAHLDEVEPPRLRAALEAHADQIRLGEDLARLRDDVPLGDGERFAPPGPDAPARLRALFERLEFRSLVPRVDAALRP